jgi:signal peptidase I
LNEGLRPEAGDAMPVPTANVAEKVHDGVLSHLQALLEIVVLAIFFATFIAQPDRVPSESMDPTLRVGDFYLVNKQACAPTGVLDRVLPAATVHRGDLVVFHYPADPGKNLVKRVVGLPGDRLRLRDGRVFLDGSPLAEPYAVYIEAQPDGFRDDFPSMRSADPTVDPRWWAELRRIVTNGEIVVPPDRYFVMGDNRNDSEDSRYWGFVPRQALIGRPLLVYFSLAAPPVTNQPGLKTSLRNRWHDIRVLR